MAVKQHQCARCRRHVAKVFEVPKKTGAKRTYCARCIQTMNAKGADIEPGPSTNEQFVSRVAAATDAANRNASNRKG
jgi:hypothetical protein